MGDNTIDAYLDAFKGGGARQYLFLVYFAFPSKVLESGLKNVLSVTDLTAEYIRTGTVDVLSRAKLLGQLPYYVRTTSLPESSYEDISVPYPGYNFKMAGTRVFNDWTVSLNIDQNNDILSAFHAWLNMIYNPQDHTYSAPIEYMVTQTLHLLGPEMNPTSKYKLYRAWPKSIGNVQLDYSSTELATVDITFSYQYYMKE
ncbi:MAG: phage tail protein [Bacteroidales bacterium]|jgi:hypothetical protein